MIQKRLGFALRNMEAGGKDYASNGLDGGRHLEKIDPLRRAGGALFPAAVGLLHNGLDCGRMVYWQGRHFRHQQRQSGYDDFNPNYHGNYHRGQHSHGAVFWQQGPVQPGQDESDDVRFRPVCGGASVRAALSA